MNLETIFRAGESWAHTSDGNGGGPVLLPAWRGLLLLQCWLYDSRIHHRNGYKQGSPRHGAGKGLHGRTITASISSSRLICVAPNFTGTTSGVSAMRRRAILRNSMYPSRTRTFRRVRTGKPLPGPAFYAPGVPIPRTILVPRKNPIINPTLIGARYSAGGPAGQILSTPGDLASFLIVHLNYRQGLCP